MAYALLNLRSFGIGAPLASTSQAPTLWHYHSNDTLAAISTSGYFNSATTLLKKGDIIFVSGDIDGTPLNAMLMIDSATAAATVTTQGRVTSNQDNYVLTSTVALTDGTSGQIVAPLAGVISKIHSVLLGGAVTTNNAVITTSIGATAVTTGVITITASGSAIGDMDTCSPSAAHTVAAGDVIKYVVSNTPGGSRTATVTMLILTA